MGNTILPKNVINLRKSVMMYNLVKNDTINDRIYISDGSFRAKSKDNNGIEFSNTAFLPRDPWHPATAEEKKQLLGKSITTKNASSIGIIKIPKRILEHIENIGFSNSKNYASFNALLHKASSQKFLGQLEILCRKLKILIKTLPEHMRKYL